MRQFRRGAIQRNVPKHPYKRSSHIQGNRSLPCKRFKFISTTQLASGRKLPGECKNCDTHYMNHTLASDKKGYTHLYGVKAYRKMMER